MSSDLLSPHRCSRMRTASSQAPCVRVSAFNGHALRQPGAGRFCGQAVRVRVTQRRGGLLVRAVETEKKPDTKDKEKADRLVRGACTQRALVAAARAPLCCSCLQHAVTLLRASVVATRHSTQLCQVPAPPPAPACRDRAGQGDGAEDSQSLGGDGSGQLAGRAAQDAHQPLDPHAGHSPAAGWAGHRSALSFASSALQLLAPAYLTCTDYSPGCACRRILGSLHHGQVHCERRRLFWQDRRRVPGLCAGALLRRRCAQSHPWLRWLPEAEAAPLRLTRFGRRGAGRVPAGRDRLCGVPVLHQRGGLPAGRAPGAPRPATSLEGRGVLWRRTLPRVIES